MIKRIIYLIFSLSLTISSIAQDNTTKKFFRNGAYFLEIGDLEKALDYFFYVYDSDNNIASINYYIGKCYFNMPREKQKAKPFLLAASKSIDTRFREFEIDETDAPPEVYLMLGELYQFDEELDSAKYFYQQYENSVKLKEDKDLAKHRLQSIDNAKKLQQHYIPYAAENLGPKINTVHSDYNPVISTDENTLAFTSFIDSKDAVFISRKENGKWSTPEDISKQISAKGSALTADISADGNKLYLIGIDSYGSDIYVSEFDGKKWSKMKPFDSKINSPYYETSFVINDAEDEVYFSSDSPESIGGLDLFYSKKDAKGKWEFPINLGRRINTPYDEESPCLAKDDKLLFFSSNGHQTMGGFDVFFSERLGENVWSQPINIGYPLNTTANDLGYVALDDGNIAYIVKDMPNGYGLVDIYKIEIPKDLLFADKLLEEAEPTGQFSHELVEQVDSATIEPIAQIEETEVEPAITTEPEIALVAPVIEKEEEKPVVEQIKEEPIEQVVEEQVPNIEPVVIEKETPVISKPEEIKEPTPELVKTEEKMPDIEPEPIEKTETVKIPTYTSGRAYTVQIIALKRPVSEEKFSMAGQVKRSDGDDGYSRYTVGYFENASLARKEILRLHKLGFKNCFIREVSTISNY